MLQNQSSVTLFTLCVHEFLMNIYMYAKFYLSTVFQSWDMDPSLWILKRSLQVIKAVKHGNINKFCSLVLDECVF